MIVHSVNNLRKEKKKEKEKERKEKKKKNKRGHKRNSIEAPCNNNDLVHIVQAWPSYFKFMSIGVVNKLG
jgi:hypothetical protein